MMDLSSVSQLDVERVWGDAKRVLGEVGLELGSDAIADSLAGTGLVSGGRLRVSGDVAEAYADELRTRHAGDLAVAPVTRPMMYNLPLNPWWLDPADGCTKPNDTATVIRNTKLVYQLTEEGLIGGSVAGVPQDVPAEMQFLMVYYLSCVYSPRPGAWSLMHSKRAMEYIFEVAAIMDQPRAVYAESISPLRLGGQSVDLAIDAGRAGASVEVDPMPVMGVTAPADWHLAWAQSVAENLGLYILLREAGIEKVGAPSMRLFTANPSACTPYFTSPKHAAVLLMRRQVRAFFGMSTGSGELMLTTSKAPDAQAVMEKMAGCLLGKLYGFRHIEGAGALWMDEVFSPQQMMIDVEIARFVEGMDAAISPPPADIVSVMEAGLAAGGFLDADLTLDRFREFAWTTELFDLAPRGKWEGDHETLLKRAAALADAKAAEYTYELTGEKRDALDTLIARARAEFG
jgi:trimethylamine:corrinoid methyltransferase-like protein